ncbi:MAG: aminopeptidase P family N-terminal domain-containing protein, partial [Bacteroidaceae bacterium]|nr:aminopeptidase P family N-terminal domain-containing protein [Bacteroidaceae bacterium]
MAHLDISHRVERLRQWMAEHQIDAMIVPTNDPHDSEYPAEYWLCRAWLTGFDGSAGTAVVTATAAALWTDSRYFLQAASQLDGTPFELMRDGEPTTPSLPEWIASQTLGETPAQGEVRIGCTAEIFMADLFDTLAQHNADFRPVATPDPFALIWPDRPALPASPIYRHEAQWTGASVGEKIAHAWAAYDKKGEKADFIVLNDLAEVAWLLNLRASDIEFNPVFYAYLVLGREGAHLFTALGRLDPAIAESLQQEGVACHEYAEIYDFIAARQDAHLTYGCPARMHRGLVAQLEAAPCQLITVINAVGQLKARKNSAELAGFRQAMLADGVALVRFLRWIEEQGQQQRLPELTEYAVSEQLRAFRAENADFIGLSFATIAGYAAHGAIVHYEAEAEGSAHLAPRGLLLLDSGAQYRSGTTDITRTLALGSLSDEERLAYTLVLKGHIALSRMRFPEGTTGLQLDTAARYAMWQEGYDYGHGTGHGVG